MTWREGYDPVAGDAGSCDALDLVIVPRVRDLGGFSVRRALPHGRRQMVGPFIFFDQMGIARPSPYEETTPTFQHFDASALPTVADHGLEARVIAGRAFGLTAPLASLSPWFYVEVKVAAGRSAPLDNDYEIGR